MLLKGGVEVLQAGGWCSERVDGVRKGWMALGKGGGC